MAPKIGIAGAGLLGRLLAYKLAAAGWEITLFDCDTRDGTRSCAHVGAGMLAPFAELETAEPLIAELGMAALPLWQALIEVLPEGVFFQQKGTLAVAHQQDRSDLERLADRVARKWTRGPVVETLSEPGLAALEPELAATFSKGLFFPAEAQLDPRTLLRALDQALTALGVRWFEETPVVEVEDGVIGTENRTHRFDLVIDTRGMGARPDLATLRGVRGELIRVHAPEVGLNRPIRLMHPRYPLYIAPRPGGIFLIGATSIESEDLGPVTVKSCLELLSAAYSLHPGFAEAGVLETAVQCRPAFPDNLPKIGFGDGLIQINGLYRHGFLTAPALVEDVWRLLNNDPVQFPALVEVAHAQSLG